MENDNFKKFMEDFNEFYSKVEFKKFLLPNTIVGPAGVNTIRLKNETETFDLPVNEFAYFSLQERAGVQGPALQKLREINWGRYSNHMQDYFKLTSKEDGLVYIYDKTAYAFHSKSYVVMPMNKLFEKSIKKLQEKYPNAALTSSQIDVVSSFFTCDINDEDVKKTYEVALNRSDLVPKVRIASSDAGQCGANIYPMIGEVYAAQPIKLNHKGETSMEKFEENLDMIHTKVMESAENIRKLSEVKINYPQECFLNIAKRILLPRELSLAVSDDLKIEFPNSCTAREIYLYFNDIINENDSESKKMKMADAISRAINIDYKKYDHSFCEWLKKRDTNQTKLW